VQAYENHEGSQRQIAQRYDVSLSFVRDLLKRYRQTGSFAPKKCSGGSTSKIDHVSLQLILDLIDHDPRTPLSTLCTYLAHERQLQISRATMCRTLRKYRPRRSRRLPAAQKSIPGKTPQPQILFSRN
jgi:transposase